MYKFEWLKNAILNTCDELTPLFKKATFLGSATADQGTLSYLTIGVYDSATQSESIMHKNHIVYAFCFVGYDMTIYKLKIDDGFTSITLTPLKTTTSSVNAHINDSDGLMEFYYAVTGTTSYERCYGGSLVLLAFNQNEDIVDRILSQINLYPAYTCSARNNSEPGNCYISFGYADKRRRAVFAAYNGNMAVCRFSSKNKLVPIYSANGKQLLMLHNSINSIYAITTDGVNKKAVYGATIVATPAE